MGSMVNERGTSDDCALAREVKLNVGKFLQTHTVGLRLYLVCVFGLCSPSRLPDAVLCVLCYGLAW